MKKKSVHTERRRIRFCRHHFILGHTVCSALPSQFGEEENKARERESARCVFVQHSVHTVWKRMDSCSYAADSPLPNRNTEPVCTFIRLYCVNWRCRFPVSNALRTCVCVQCVAEHVCMDVVAVCMRLRLCFGAWGVVIVSGPVYTMFSSLLAVWTVFSWCVESHQTSFSSEVTVQPIRRTLCYVLFPTDLISIIIISFWFLIFE